MYRNPTVAYLDNMRGAELPKWLAAAEPELALRSGALCLASNGPEAENKNEKINVPVDLRMPLI